MIEIVMIEMRIFEIHPLYYMYTKITTSCGSAQDAQKKVPFHFPTDLKPSLIYSHSKKCAVFHDEATHCRAFSNFFILPKISQKNEIFGRNPLTLHSNVNQLPIPKKKRDNDHLRLIESFQMHIFVSHSDASIRGEMHFSKTNIYRHSLPLFFVWRYTFFMASG